MPPPEPIGPRAELSLGAFHAETRGRELQALIRARVGAAVRTIADVGGGDGAAMFPIAVGGARALCIDLDRERLAVGVAEARRRGLPMLYLEGDAGALPVASGSCDVVVLYGVLETMPTFAPALIEAARVLRTDGCAIIVTPNPLSPIAILDDPHMHLPLAHLLPSRVARRYARIFGRRLPSFGEAFRSPRWGELSRAAAVAGLTLELESTLLLKISDPEFVIGGWKRPIARAMRTAGVDRLLRRRGFAAGRRFWDRHLARSWLLLAWKR